MNDPPARRPTRRPRYRGKNPREFEEKYKELQPDHYAEEAAKVIAGGKTPVGTHRPIMVREILDFLAPRPAETALDCTIGYGGHTRELLAAVQPGGKLLGIDADPVELSRTTARLNTLGFPPDSIITRALNFAALPRFIAEMAPGGVDLVLADLGLSSMQIDNPARGFTFKADGPLDMRMNQTKGQPASALLSTLSQAGLSRILTENADEPRADEVAAAILQAHARTPLMSTRALSKVVQDACKRFPRHAAGTADDTVRRVFQAIRIAVNHEFEALDALLRALPLSLKAGGRVAILSFHSGEDRRVKAAFKEGFQDGIYTTIATEPIRASAEECRSNPRSTSAKLRYAIRAL